MLGNKTKDQIRRDRRDLIETGFAKLPFDVVFFRKAKAAVSLHCDIGRLPRRVSREQLGHVGFGSAWLPTVEQLRGANTHQIGSLNVRVGFCDRKLNTLVLSNRASEDDALL